MDNKFEHIRGGFPRIKLNKNQLVKKAEQGFSGIYSINDIMKKKKTQHLTIDNDDGLQIVGDRTINGIDIDIFAKP